MNPLELVTFEAGGSSYGIDIQEVREIKRIGGYTVVHHSPPFVRGVINLRGQIVTLVDIGKILGFAESGTDQPLTIVFVRSGGETVGLAVDAVQDTVLVDPALIQPLPGNFPGDYRKFFQGIYSLDNEFVSMLDLEVLLASDGR